MQNLLRIFFVLLGLSALSTSGTVTVQLNALENEGLIKTSDGSLLPDGSVARVGFFDISLTTLTPSELLDYSLLNSHFTEWTSFTANTGLIAESGEFFESKEAAAQTGNPQIYLWVFNSALPSTAEEYGIFTSSDSEWDAANDLGSNNLVSSKIDQTIVGSEDASTPTNYLLTPVPEPAHFAMVFGLLGLGVVLWRRRRG